MDCQICNEHHCDLLQHVRLMHPDVLDEAWKLALGPLLKAVTPLMDREDWVCEQCDKQFQLGMTYGELFEGMFGEYPIVSLVCGDCFLARPDGT